ncbi:uncharacterized protein LOC124380978 [Silurus meridionalis]|uniref:uncharacterized protein LOC124380978 n=1 Tax=Silurus meridionalis TaxID=175797 RepID=UPI001EEB4C4A|nr:uncharacterized protein LOC124380978 [Silurus meridionalis]
MVPRGALLVFLSVISLLSETLCSSILEAEVGDDVTIWCKHELKHTDQIFWFKHTNDSVPLLLGCKQIRTSAPSQNCYFFTESNRMVMSVQGENTSLTITAVNVSDTGLYYCSSIRLDQIIFGNSTSLRVEGGNKTFPKIPHIEKGSYGVFFMLSVMSVIVFLLCGLIFFIQNHRKIHTGAKEKDTENWKKKTRRMQEELHYSYVGFSSVAQ